MSTAYSAVYLVEGLQVSANVKQQLAEFYQNRGEFPSSNKELGLSEPGRFVGQSLMSLDVSEGGVITLRYDKKSGVENGIIRLTPDVSNPAMGIQWRCVTPSYQNVGAFMPQCKYVP